MIARAAEPEEYAEICDLAGKAFKQSKLESQIIRTTTGEDPNFQEGDLRIAEENGKILSMMVLTRRPLRVGTAVVSGANVGPVVTHPDYQGKGCCSAVMRNAVQYMESQGLDMTILWAISWLYPHCGYSPAMLRTELFIKPRDDGPAKKELGELRRFTEDDLEEMTRIYNSNTAARTCAEIRSPRMWDWRPGGSEVKLEVLRDSRGQVIGYRALGRDWGGKPCAHEIGVVNDESCEVMFASLLETAKEKGLKELRCIVHPDHPFSRFAFWRDCEIRMQSGGGAGMARVLNLVSLLTNITKEFERRLRHSELHKIAGSLKITSEEESAFLEISRGEVSISSDSAKDGCQLDIPLACLNPLITGYKDIRELAKNPHLKVKGGKHALRLIEVLFPKGHPYGGIPPLFWE